MQFNYLLLFLEIKRYGTSYTWKQYLSSIPDWTPISNLLSWFGRTKKYPCLNIRFKPIALIGAP